MTQFCTPARSGSQGERLRKTKFLPSAPLRRHRLLLLGAITCSCKVGTRPGGRKLSPDDRRRAKVDQALTGTDDARRAASERGRIPTSSSGTIRQTRISVGTTDETGQCSTLTAESSEKNTRVLYGVFGGRKFSWRDKSFGGFL